MDGCLVLFNCCSSVGQGFCCKCLLFCQQVRPPGPLHSDSGIKILLLILALGGLQWARGSGRLFLVIRSLWFSSFSFLASAVAFAALLSSSVLFVAMRVSPFPLVFLPCCCVSCVCFSVLGVRGGFFSFFSCRLLKRVCSSPTGASQHAKLASLSCLLSVHLAACLSSGM